MTHRHKLAHAIIGSALLALAFTGSAGATALVTGAQIKDQSVTGADVRDGRVTGTDIGDRTISATDLSPDLAVPAGPVGPVGPAGPAGAVGAPGTTGLRAVTYQRSYGIHLDPGKTHGIQMKCDGRGMAIAGGVTSSSPSTTRLAHSAPHTDRQVWTTYVRNDGPSLFTFHAWIACADAH